MQKFVFIENLSIKLDLADLGLKGWQLALLSVVVAVTCGAVMALLRA